MALFGRKKTSSSTKALEGKEEKKEIQKARSASADVSSSADLSNILRSPRITEKASLHISSGVYAFDVSESATKRSIAQAIVVAYKVRPRKIAIVSVKAKVRRNARTGQYGMSRGGKKAYVYLKKGETITIS